jgi:hypothetical protein
VIKKATQVLPNHKFLACINKYIVPFLNRSDY